MYTDNKTIQIVIALFKQFGIRHLVLSPGTRNVPFVHSVEQDNYFKCYSIVDERSAGYFAIGLALETGEPVAMSCTSSTASTNYTSAMWEATRQKLPLIALTSDRNPYYLNQYEDQMIDQNNLYRSAARKSVTLPIVTNANDEWYCYRLVNEALLELNHHGGGPVHINMPTEWGLFAQNFNTKLLPSINPIKRIDFHDLNKNNDEIHKALISKRRILVMYGQGRTKTEGQKEIIERFAKKYNCVFTVETISNFTCSKSLNSCLISRVLNKETIKVLAPDLIISVEGDYVSTLKGLFKGCDCEFEHWIVNKDGTLIDQFKRLTNVFECSTEEFFDYFNYFEYSENNSDYFEKWSSVLSELLKPNFEYSSNYIMQEFSNYIPDHSIVHLGNGVAVHIAQYFSFNDTIISYCHTGTTTIDGSMSTFIGQAALSKKLCFAFIGDLSFFYDMNSIWNRYVGNNVRILLYNNEGGETFHWNAAKEIDTLSLHTSAGHFSTAKGWVESRGFRYLTAKTKEEFDKLLPEFMIAQSETPIFFEVFTKKESDAKILLDYYEECRRILDKKLND